MGSENDPLSAIPGVLSGAERTRLAEVVPEEWKEAAIAAIIEEEDGQPNLWIGQRSINFPVHDHAIRLSVPNKACCGLGSRVWAASWLLSFYLKAQPELLAGKRVLELGAGIGLTGLVAAGCGALEVVLTEYERTVLGYLSANIKENTDTRGVNPLRATSKWLGECRVRLAECRFEDDLRSLDPMHVPKPVDKMSIKLDAAEQFDVIIGSDIVYT
ncbi:hypothetical protein CYMTET_43383, partial [Cymbomonas tetramitiformis]